MTEEGSVLPRPEFGTPGRSQSEVCGEPQPHRCHAPLIRGERLERLEQRERVPETVRWDCIPPGETRMAREGLFDATYHVGLDFELRCLREVEPRLDG